MWVCPFCFQRNPFPQRYYNLQSTPPELLPNLTTVEYKLSKPYTLPPAFMFVLDLAQPAPALQHMKESLLMALSLIPETAHVALIVFAETVSLLSSSNSYKTY
jgi:protein transport protein SEC23